jgi:hypothetical protein
LPQPCCRCGLTRANRARILFEGLASQAVACSRQGMATVSQLNPYRCEQCGTANIVAAPVLYQQGTSAYSGTFSSGLSQSYSARTAAPPRPRRYVQAVLRWGPLILFLSVWSIVSSRSVLELPRPTMYRVDLAAALLLLEVVSFVGLAFNLRRIARYNREIYPRLHWDWEHTYICKRCGKLRLIPS